MYETFDNLTMSAECLHVLQEAITERVAMGYAKPHVLHELICFGNEIRARLQHVEGDARAARTPTDDELCA
jgi:hypothetical protein